MSEDFGISLRFEHKFYLDLFSDLFHFTSQFKITAQHVMPNHSINRNRKCTRKKAFLILQYCEVYYILHKYPINATYGVVHLKTLQLNEKFIKIFSWTFLLLYIAWLRSIWHRRSLYLLCDFNPSLLRFYSFFVFLEVLNALWEYFLVFILNNFYIRLCALLNFL